MEEEALRVTGERAFELLEAAVEDPSSYPERFVAFELDEDTLPRILTRQRLRLLRVLRQEGPVESVTRLSERLGRDQGQVSRDLAYLEGWGLVELERDGRSKTVRAPDRPILLI